MAFYVDIHESCKKQAEDVNAWDFVQKFKEKIEAEQRSIAALWWKFDTCYIRNCGGGRAIIARQTQIENDIYYIEFLGIIEWSSKEYKSKKLPAFHEKSEQEKREFIARQNEENPPTPKPNLDNNEYLWLYDAFSHQVESTDDLMVYETNEWKDAVSKDNISQQLNRICKELSSSLYLDDGFHELQVGDKQNWHIYVLKIGKNLFLLYPFTDKDSQVYELEKKAQWKDKEEQEIIRSCRRAYPAFMLLDEETWMEIEKEKVASMALSPEECDVLKKAREYKFPLFINGRAGSGKSTILQYVFADLLYHKINKDKESDLMPIYLTANKELLNIAKETTTHILKAELKKNGKDANEDSIKDIREEAFCEFRQYLLDLLPREEINNYKKEKRIGFVEFKKEWNSWRGHEDMKDCGAEISWHVIRTYIKGMFSLSDIKINELYMASYEELNYAERSVTDEVFKKVLDKVWNKYSKWTKDNEYWDDQDLALYILEKDLAKAKHPAILCDEAQDFTRIELEILFRLNLFSNRSIEPQDIGRVPFAFAGDQFQTLNPTGFRWDAMKASFTEKLIKNFDSNSKIELNYIELTYNYRSTKPIVCFSNGVQCLRSVLFKIFDLSPQKTWLDQQNSIPVYCFEEADGIFWEKIKETPCAILVPCDEGEEYEFVKNNEVLSKNVKIQNEVPENVFSSIRAKGIEFSTVIVYGFGNRAPDFKKELKILDSQNASTKQLPHEYFINKLYVSVSRAKQRLMIVDKKDDISNFWSFMLKTNETKEIVDKANRGKEPKKWNDDDIMSMEKSDGSKDITKTEDKGELEALARELEENARVKKDPYLWEQAAFKYQRLKKHEKAEECSAEALELNNQYLDAAKKFLQLNKTERAIGCYWKEGEEGFKELANINADENISNSIEFRFAREYTQEYPKIIPLLNSLSDKMNEKEFISKILNDEEILQSWKKMLNKLIDKSIKNTNKNHAEIMLDKLLLVKSACDVDIEEKWQGKLLFIAEKFEESLQYLDERSPEYKKAEIAVTPYPENLEKINNADDRIAEFEKNKEKPLDWKFGSIIARDYLGKNQYRESFSVAFECGNENILKKIMERSKNENIKFALVKILARSEKLVGSKVNEKKEWSAFLRDEFLDPFLDSRNISLKNISSRELGAAIERAGKYADAIVYYKHLEANSLDDEKAFARERYIVSLGRRSIDRKDVQDLKLIGMLKEKWEYKDEFVASLPEYPALPLAELPEYPELPSVEEPSIELEKKEQKAEIPVSVELPNTVRCKMGNISITLLREAKRINFVESEDAGRMASIKFAENILIEDTENLLEGIKADFSENKKSITLNFVKVGVSMDLLIS